MKNKPTDYEMKIAEHLRRKWCKDWKSKPGTLGSGKPWIYTNDEYNLDTLIARTLASYKCELADVVKSWHYKKGGYGILAEAIESYNPNKEEINMTTQTEQCACRQMTVEETLLIVGNWSPNNDDRPIKMCSLHESAHVLLEACKDTFDALMRVRHMVKLPVCIDQLEQAITKAEGSQHVEPN